MDITLFTLYTLLCMVCALGGDVSGALCVWCSRWIRVYDAVCTGAFRMYLWNSVCREIHAAALKYTARATLTLLACISASVIKLQDMGKGDRSPRDCF